MNRRSMLFSAAAIATTGVLGAAVTPRSAQAKMLPDIVGTWRISDAAGHPVEDLGIMRIGGFGEIIIALTGRLSGADMPATVSSDVAARLYRGTVILQGHCSPILNPQGDRTTAINVTIEQVNVAAMYFKRFRLDLDVHTVRDEQDNDDPVMMVSRTGADAPFQLNRSWVQLERS